MATAAYNSMSLRAKCASLGVASSIYVQGKRVAFSHAELAWLVRLLEANAMGEKLYKRTLLDEATCNLHRASSRAHVFWSDPCHGNWPHTREFATRCADQLMEHASRRDGRHIVDLPFVSGRCSTF